MSSKVNLKKASGSAKSSPNTLEEYQQAGRDTIYNLVANMHLQSKYSDITIICEGQSSERSFEAHKIVVCQRSEYLADLCKGPGHLKDPSKPLVSTREPILFEKVLEFLYKSDYTVPRNPIIKPVGTSEIQAFKKAQLAKVNADKTRTAQSTEPKLEETEDLESLEAFDQLDNELEEMEDAVQEDILHSDEFFLEKCHPCYFHARMYIEAGWWKVQDLKVKAKAHFTKAFMDNRDPKSFSKTIEAIYAINTNCAELKDEVIKSIVPNIPMFWRGAGGSESPPVLNVELLKLVPDFTFELVPKILDNVCPDKRILSQPAEKKRVETEKKKMDNSKRA